MLSLLVASRSLDFSPSCPPPSLRRGNNGCSNILHGSVLLDIKIKVSR